MNLLMKLSIYERIHLARSFATAILQYYVTPWLRNPLRCEDVYFFDIQVRLLLQNISAPLTEPHINVQIRKSSNTLPSAAYSEQLAPNIILFNLGIMLIELAYMVTFRNLLNQKELSVGGPQRKYTELFAARRLGGVVDREMGSKYSKIVQKCIGSHFASGYDLSSSELQAEYYRDVIQEFESLEQDFASININS